MSDEQDGENLNRSQNEDDKEEDSTTVSENSEDTLDENEFEKAYENNKEEIDALLTVFESHSHLMKVLIAIELWGFVLDKKCAIQRIVRPTASMMQEMKATKELPSPLPNPKKLHPKDTKLLRKLWEKTKSLPELPAPLGLKSLEKMKEKMSYESFRDIYLTNGRKLYFHFQLLNPETDSKDLKENVIQEFGKCESKRDLELAFSVYEKKRRNELGIKSTSNNNKDEVNDNNINDDDANGSKKGAEKDDDDADGSKKGEENDDDDTNGSKKGTEKDDDDADCNQNSNVPVIKCRRELTQASSPSGRPGLRARSQSQLHSMTLGCGSSSPAKKKKKTTTTKFLWNFTAPKLNQKDKSTDREWFKEAKLWAHYVLPLFVSILFDIEDHGKPKLGVLSQHYEEEKKEFKALSKRDEVNYEKEKASLDLSAMTLDNLKKLCDKHTSTSKEVCHISDRVIAAMISIGMIDVDTEEDEDAMKSLKLWISDENERVGVYQSLKKMDVLIQRKKASQFIRIVNQNSSIYGIYGEYVIATVKRMESQAKKKS